jgi:hypothetical protein
VLSGVSEELSAVFLAVLEDAQSGVGGSNHKGEFCSVLVKFEFLSSVSGVITDCEFALFADSEGLACVEDGHDSVVSVCDRGELGRNFTQLTLLLWLLRHEGIEGDIGLLWLLLLLLLGEWLTGGNDEPGLIVSIVGIPLDYLGSVDHGSTCNIEGTVASMGLNHVSFA